jgi:hypothetical protein
VTINLNLDIKSENIINDDDDITGVAGEVLKLLEEL